jgi:hypothetical protein
MEYQQNSLFSTRSYRVTDRWEPYLAMSLEIVCNWQERIKSFQQKIKNERPYQFHLFVPSEPNLIDPFSLAVFPEDFYRLPKKQGDACIYFVIDFNVPLLLYVGETNHSHKRWRGLHDCKNYLNQYRTVLQSHHQNCSIGLTFYWDAPLQKQARLKLEQSFITRWRPPFNKENWHYWQTPFVL